jgi:hypothetical protein
VLYEIGSTEQLAVSPKHGLFVVAEFCFGTVGGADPAS